MATKKVRIHNATSDVDNLRVYIQHFDANTQLVVDVPKGGYVQNNHMSQGHRGIVAYEDLNEELILTGSFELTTRNMKVSVNGDAASGYTMAQAIMP